MFKEVELELSPSSDGLVPHSDGYLVYSTFLDRLSDFNEESSTVLHELDCGMNVSCLDGVFKYYDSNRKQVFEDETYTVLLSFVGKDIPLQDILSCLMGSDTDFQIGDVVFDIVSFYVNESSISDLKAERTNNSIRVEFVSPTRIIHNDSVEVFPHRGAVIDSIQNKWNQIFDETIKLSRDEIRNAVYVQGGSIELNHHNVRVSGVRESSVPAFTGEITLNKTPSCDASVWDDIQLLLYAGSYLGVGSDVKRGLGSILVSQE